MTGDVKIIVPIGPGRGEFKPLREAIYALLAEIRGHVRDLKDNGENDKAELLGRYLVALDLIWQQFHPTSLFGVGLSLDLGKQAKKYNLAIPLKENINPR